MSKETYFDTGINILVLGATGNGKTSSLSTLEPSETVIFTPKFKSLPFPKWKPHWELYDKLGGKAPDTKKGLIVVCKDFDFFLKAINSMLSAKNRFKNIIVDDFQYLITKNVFGRAEEKSFEKWIELARDIYNSLELITNKCSATGKRLAILWHSNNDTNTEARGTRVMTSSKWIDEVFKVEGIFTYVIEAEKRDGKYGFVTNDCNNNNAGVKTPLGCFEEEFIPNDMKLVFDTIDKYENE